MPNPENGLYGLLGRFLMAWFGCWNGEGVKGSWNTAGSAATEDMPRKPLDALAVTHAPVMGVGGLRPKAVPLHP